MSNLDRFPSGPVKNKGTWERSPGYGNWYSPIATCYYMGGWQVHVLQATVGPPTKLFYCYNALCALGKVWIRMISEYAFMNIGGTQPYSDSMPQPTGPMLFAGSINMTA